MTEQHRRLIQQGDRMQIRTASTSDALGIAVVHRSAIREAYSYRWPPEKLVQIETDFPGKVEAWRDHLAEGSSTTLVAEVDGEIVGVVEFEPWEDEGSPETMAEVTTLSVDPEEWGRGVGEALMREAMARLRDGGWVEVVVSVREEALRAVDLFQRLGFRWDKTRSSSGRCTAMAGTACGSAGPSGSPSSPSIAHVRSVVAVPAHGAAEPGWPGRDPARATTRAPTSRVGRRSIIEPDPRSGRG